MTTRRLKSLLPILAFAAAFFAAGNGSAQIPQTINYQGYLTNASSQPVNASVNVTFRLYNTMVDGAPVWQETQSGIGVVNGVFNAVLGSVSQLKLPFDVPYFLSLQVNSDAEMATRQPLSAVPYALRAAAADALSAGAAIPAVQITGTISGSQLAATQLLPTSACPTNYIPQWSGTAWACAAGTAGTQGPVGPAGPAGPQGPPGPAGTAASPALNFLNSVVGTPCTAAYLCPGTNQLSIGDANAITLSCVPSAGTPVARSLTVNVSAAAINKIYTPLVDGGPNGVGTGTLIISTSPSLFAGSFIRNDSTPATAKSLIGNICDGASVVLAISLDTSSRPISALTFSSDCGIPVLAGSTDATCTITMDTNKVVNIDLP